MPDPAYGGSPGSCDVDLSSVDGTGPKGRITKEDLLQTLRGPADGTDDGRAGSRWNGNPTDSGGGLCEVRARSRSSHCRGSRRISGPFLHRSWLNVPHVTHGDRSRYH